jgi:hypothetical protein
MAASATQAPRLGRTFRAAVDYVVQVTPPDEGVPYYHKLFDVDDPTRTGPPVDDPGDPPTYPGGDDNRAGGPIDGSEGQRFTGPGGTSTVTFELYAGAAHPGDNWRKVVAIKQDRINIIQVEEPSSTGALLNVGGHGVAQTPMISIWRTLWVELDHMAAPPEGTTFNTDEIDCQPPSPTVVGNCGPGPGGAQREPGLNVLQLAFRAAYVEPKVVTDEYNVARVTLFNHNLNGVEQAAMAQLFRDTGDGDRWFWTAYALSAYEGSDLSDNDPDTEDELRGRNEPDEPEWAAVFLETIRDMYQDGEYTFAPTYSQARLEAQTLAHEIAHQFEVPDPNPLNDPVRSIMSTVVPPNGRPDNFDGGELDIIRDQEFV